MVVHTGLTRPVGVSHSSSFSLSSSSPPTPSRLTLPYNFFFSPSASRFFLVVRRGSKRLEFVRVCFSPFLHFFLWSPWILDLSTGLSAATLSSSRSSPQIHLDTKPKRRSKPKHRTPPRSTPRYLSSYFVHPLVDIGASIAIIYLSPTQFSIFSDCFVWIVASLGL
jgi:hypothetical protein